MKKIESIRGGGRVLVCFFNFDRMSYPSLDEVVETSFNTDAKEPLFRVLRESVEQGAKIDLYFYTRGGDIDSVWPMVNLLREYDPDFEVLVPYRCHSAGTLLCLGSKMIHMTPLSELGPIDPRVANVFNPRAPGGRPLLPIYVEDVKAYREFLLDQVELPKQNTSAEERRAALSPFIQRFVETIHPLALGNIHRSHQQIQRLAKELLSFHPPKNNLDQVVHGLVTGFYSHSHGISIAEAQSIIGEEKVKATSQQLSEAMDELLRAYEKDFHLRSPFLVDRFLDKRYDPLFWTCVEKFKAQDNRSEIEAFVLDKGNLAKYDLSVSNALRKLEEAEQFVQVGTGEREARIIGGAIESTKWSYLFETKISLSRHSIIPEHIHVDVPPGESIPYVVGLEKDYGMTVHSSAWVRNEEPKGVTL